MMRSRGCDSKNRSIASFPTGMITFGRMIAISLSRASVVPSDSPMRFARRRPLPGTGPYRIASFDPRRFRSRHLIVIHRRDVCRVTLPANGEASHRSYGTELIVMDGGKSTGEDCEAFSHHGYNGSSGGLASIGSDTGLRPRPAWEPWTGALHVAAGSHAGTTAPAIGDSRAIHRGDLLLIPAEPVAAASRARFAVTPPWLKEVWSRPESMGT